VTPRELTPEEAARKADFDRRRAESLADRERRRREQYGPGTSGAEMAARDAAGKALLRSLVDARAAQLGSTPSSKACFRCRSTDDLRPVEGRLPYPDDLLCASCRRAADDPSRDHPDRAADQAEILGQFETTPTAGGGSTTNPPSGGAVAEDATTAPETLTAWDTIAKFAQSVLDQIEADAGSGWDIAGDADATEHAHALIEHAKAKHTELDPMVEAAEGKTHQRSGQYQDA
jgi:hypothetical protein